MKKKYFSVVVVVLAIFFCVQSSVLLADTKKSVFAGSKDEVYYMNVFVTGAQFWKGCWDGFQAAAEQLGVTVKYNGTPEYDATAHVTSFEQTIAKSPAGIIVCPIDEDSFIDPINMAIDAGVMVSTFFIDSAKSKRNGYLGSDPIFEGEMAAKFVGEELKNGGEVGIIERPQANVMMRINKFKEVLAKDYPKIKIVASVFAEASEVKATEVTTAMFQAHPEMDSLVAFSAIEAIGAAIAKEEMGAKFSIITFEAEPAVLDYIKSGTITATIGQDSFSAGYWSLVALYMAKHQLIKPYTDWNKTSQFSPLPSYINTGNNVITKANVENFYIKEW